MKKNNLTFSIKHMVCDRCILAVKEVIDSLPRLNIVEIDLGFVKIEPLPNNAEKNIIHARLKELGFELSNDKRSALITKLKSIIIKRIHHNTDYPEIKLNDSDYLTKKMGYDYSYLNKIFSEQEGKTIGKYILQQKIERIKELLIYDELSLSEIAWRMNYSSVQYLSSQFRKLTGVTPTQFKQNSKNHRQTLDSL